MTDHISDLKWDRMLAGELPSDEADAARAHAAECERCAARLRELMAGLEAFQARPTPIALAPRRNLGVWIATAGAVAAAAAIVFVMMRPRAPSDEEEPGHGIKGGGPELILEVGRDGAHIPVSSRDAVYPGDVLQAGYSSPRDGYGAVLSIDGNNNAFAYVPAVGEQMLALRAGERRPFPQSTTLDDVLGTERVVVIWCDSPRSIVPLVGELQTTGKVTAPSGCVARHVELTKQALR